MNLEDIDNIFNNNQHQFDKMPSDQLWERLEDKLDATPSMWEEKPQPKVKWLRYVAAAAVILIMMIPAMYLIEGPTMMSSKEDAISHHTVAKTSNEITNRAKDSNFQESKEGFAAKTDKIIEQTTEQETNLIAKADTKRKSPTTAKKEVDSNQFSFQKNTNNRDTEKTKAINNPKPKAATKNRSFEMAKKPASPSPSMSEDAEVGDFEEESIVVEETTISSKDDVAAYKNASPLSKTTGKINTNFDITNTEGIYAYARYNAEFHPNHFSNALPYDGYGNDRLAQSTLKKAPQTKGRKAGNSKKMKKREQSKDRNNDNISLKRSASKEESPALESLSLGFLNSLSGTWSYSTGSLRFEENWRMTPEGSLLGTALTTENGQVLFSEDISIVTPFGNTMIYTIQHPNNSQTLTLNLNTSETSIDNENYLVFENPLNDFPSKITYRLSTDTMLQITFEGKKEGKIISKQLIMYKE
ncbi:MAG: DUF6265 family protein [Chitinophagales bacterium]